MKIIYHCYGGTHSSVTAACIHLGLLPRDRVPKYKELIGQELFDRQKVCDIGKIVFMGHDSLGNDIYVVGRQSRPKLLYNVTGGLAELFGIDRDSLMPVDVSSYVNPSMKAGGFMSRKMGLVGLGRPIVAWGTLRNYIRLVAVVEKVYAKLKQAPGTKGGQTIQIINPEVVY
ncbi:MAG: DUF3189 family protein [Bacillota bacterium]